MTTGLVADQQILRGAAGALSWQYLDASGEPADPGTVTVGVTRADGTVLVAAGQATVGTGINPRTFALTAVQTTALDVLTATWTRTVDATTTATTAEIVGGYYVSIAAARASDPVLADEAKYPTVDMVGYRRDVETEFEEICQVAFVPRYRRQRVDGTGDGCLLLPIARPRRIIAVADVAPDGTTTTAWTAAAVAAIRLDPEGSGVITSPLRSFLCGALNVLVAWEHGYDRPPNDILTAALLRLRHRATRRSTAIPDRATSFQVEGGSVYRLDTAGRKRTGIPDIDGALDRWDMTTPGIG